MAAVKQLHDGIQPLSVYHVGGDEVAKGAWSQSPACQRLKLRLKARQATSDDDAPAAVTSDDLKTYFIRRSSSASSSKLSL